MGKMKCFLILDVETCGDMEAPLVYDLGAQVVNLSGRVLESASWTIYDIYAGQRELMKSAYYADKLPQYEIDMREGKRVMKRFFSVRKIIHNWLKHYDVLAVCAYNAKFDRLALNNTIRFLTDGRMKWFFPYGTEFIDIWNMASSTIFQTAKFRKMAYENGWYTSKGNVLTNAEVAYRYLTGNTQFEEAHTGLEDVKIETEIFLHCWKKTSSADRKIIGQTWRKPQPMWRYTEAKMDGVI